MNRVVFFKFRLVTDQKYCYRLNRKLEMEEMSTPAINEKKKQNLMKINLSFVKRKCTHPIFFSIRLPVPCGKLP